MDENLTSVLTFGLLSSGSLLLTVILTKKLKPRVWWQHLSKALFIFILAAATFVLLGFTYYSIEEYYEDRPRKVTSFASVALGMTYGDLLFVKGEPNKLFKGGQKVEDRITIPEYYSRVVFYDKSSEESLMIRFDANDKVISISLFCDTNPYEKIHGIHCGADVPLPRLAAYNVITDTTTDNLSRLYCYPELNTCFAATKAKVEAIHLYNPEFYPNGLRYTKR